MIKCISLVIAATLLVTAIQQARADSLVCKYGGQILTYTEAEESDDKDTVRSVHLNEISSRVRFHNDKEYRFGSIIPCVMIKEEVGETKFLKEYLAQFE